MKKMFFPLLALVIVSTSFAQNKLTCCAKLSATRQFALLAGNKKFRMEHKDPLPFRYKDGKGQFITFKATDGNPAYGYEVKAAISTNNYVFVFHEWYGLNDYIKQKSEELQNEVGNANVIAIDLYDQKIATNRDEAGKYMQTVKQERAIAIIKGAIAYVGKHAKIGTIGWCFGGGWSLQAALLAGKQAHACVMYYGMPEKDIARLKTLNTDVLAIFANKDQWINPKLANEFAANMKKAGKPLMIKRYNADHGFANPSNPVFDKEAASDAWAATIAYFKNHFKS